VVQTNSRKSLTANLFASIIDHPKSCVFLILILSLVSWGGFNYPNWPIRFYGWLTGTDGSQVLSLDQAEDEDSMRPRRRSRRTAGSGGQLGRADTILVIQSEQLFTYEGAEALRDIVSQLEDLKTVDSVSWMDTAPPLNIFGLPEPVVPRGKASPQRFAVSREKAINNPLVVGQYLSPDARTTLMMISFDWLFVHDDADCTDRIVEMANKVLENHPSVDMSVSVTGPVPIRLMLEANRTANERKFQLIAYGIILLMATVLFRGLLVVAVVAAAPIMGVLWTLGFMRYFGLEDNPFSPVIVPILVSLVGFTDSVHMMVYVRRRLKLGDDPVTAGRNALSAVGLACFLTSLTTAVGMGTLSFAHHAVVREFGWACVIGVFVTWLSVMMAIPLFCRTPLGGTLAAGVDRAFIEKNLNWFTGSVRNFLKYPKIASFTAIGLLIFLLAIASTLRPDDRTSNLMPKGSPAQQTLALLDEALGGLDVCRIEIGWENLELEPEEVAALVSEVDRILEDETLIGHPLSVVRLLAAMPGDDPPEEKMSMVDLFPPPLKLSVFDPEARKAAVRFRVQDLGTATYKPVFERIEQRLNLLQSQNPGVTLSMEGGPIWKWRDLYRIVIDLVTSLGSASIIILLILAIAFRSARIGLISIVPNTLPLAAAGAWLVFIGQPLEMVSVCAFTICLGIAVDDTIHFLTRYREEQQGTGSRNEKIERAFHGVGTGLIMTTVVLVAGFGSVLTSETPEHRTFAMMGAITLSVALLVDLFLLPAMLSQFDRDDSSVESR
jgi:predicted RND superfamily exporter protein